MKRQDDARISPKGCSPLQTAKHPIGAASIRKTKRKEMGKGRGGGESGRGMMREEKKEGRLSDVR